MRVLCEAEYPRSEDLEDLGSSFYKNQRFDVTAGRSYLVLGLSFYQASTVFGKGLVFTVAGDDNGEPSRAPACLFRIEDPRASSLWELRVTEGDLHLWPASFYRDYYFEDLSESVPEVVEDYSRLLERMRAE